MSYSERKPLKRELYGQSSEESESDRSVVQLDLTYRLPSLCGNEQETQRLANEDLPEMTFQELSREAGLLNMVLLFGVNLSSWARPWLEERARLCAALLKQR